MTNYDIIIYERGTEPVTIKTAASNPVIAFDLAVRTMHTWPAERKEQVVGLTLKPEDTERA